MLAKTDRPLTLGDGRSVVLVDLGVKDDQDSSPLCVELGEILLLGVEDRVDERAAKGEIEAVSD